MKTSHRAIIVAIILSTTASCAEPAVQVERDAQSIRSTVREHSREIAACYDSLLEQTPDAQGSVVASFAIDPSGAVSQVSIASDDLASPDLEACMVSAIESWLFAPVESSEPVTVNYPFTLRHEADQAPQRTDRLDRNAIREVFSGASTDFQRCYEAGLLEDPTLEGQVTAHLTIAEDGTVSELSLESSTLASDSVNACLEARLGTLSFPAHSEGEVTVNYPLRFSSSR